MSFYHFFSISITFYLIKVYDIITIVFVYLDKGETTKKILIKLVLITTVRHISD